MEIAYFKPFSHAWAKMISALFHPFEIKKWFILGFTAFIAELTDGFQGNNPVNNKGSGGNFNFEKLFDIPAIVTNWLGAHPLWLSLIIFGLIFFVAFIVLLIWLSSRRST